MMKRASVMLLSLMMTSSVWAFGKANAWSSGWGQGVNEYQATVNDRNKLYIACPDWKGYESERSGAVSMTLTLKGKEYGSYNNKHFDLIIDGQRYEKPYVTNSHVSSDRFYRMWNKMRQAKSIVAVTENGQTLKLPTRNIKRALPSTKSKLFECSTQLDN